MDKVELIQYNFGKELIMKRFSTFILLLVIMVTITSHTFTNVSIMHATEITNSFSIQQANLLNRELLSAKTSESVKPSIKGLSTQKREALKINVLALVVASTLSPGITLLKIAYCADEYGSNLKEWFPVFWFLAILDFLADKIPGIASAFQLAQHPLIWAALYLALGDSTILPLILIAALMTSACQILRQILTLFLDFFTVGVASPVRSILEDVVTAIIILNFC